MSADETPLASKQDLPEAERRPGGGTDFIRDAWYVAARAGDVSPRRPLDALVCGETLRLSQDGEQARTGTVTAMTARGEERPARISEDLVWTYLPGALAAPRSGPPCFGGPKGRVRFMETNVIPAHQDDAVYGLLDPAHTPFVHRSPIWRGDGALKVKRKRFEPEDDGFTMMPHGIVNSDIYKIIGGRIEVRIHFKLPGLRAEYIRNERHTVLGLTALTPVDARHTRLRQIFYWDTPVLAALRPFARLFARPFIQQDVDIMGLRRLNEGYRARGMLLGDSDRQFLWYMKLKREWAAAHAEGRPFANPLTAETLSWRT